MRGPSVTSAAHIAEGEAALAAAPLALKQVAPAMPTLAGSAPQPAEVATAAAPACGPQPNTPRRLCRDSPDGTVGAWACRGDGCPWCGALEQAAAGNACAGCAGVRSVR